MASQADINKKTREMISEGYRPDVASAAVHSMARRRKLGKGGTYKRVHKKKRGPLGRMKARRRRTMR